MIVAPPMNARARAKRLALVLAGLTLALAAAACSDSSSRSGSDGAPKDTGSAERAAVAEGGPGGDAPVSRPDVRRDGSSPNADSTRDAPVVTDLAPAPEGGTCAPVVAKASPDAWAMRHPSAGFGGIVTQNSGGHQDVFLLSPTKQFRIGARLDWGGTVVFFGISADPASNVIDANDPGRELQIAIYDPDRNRQGCAYNATCASSSATCGNSITFLGWNPVQGGDECQHGAPVTQHGQSGDALRLVIKPLQWNPDWNAPDCRKSACGASGVPVDVTYTFELRYVREHVVEVMTQVQSAETIDHAPTRQELPTLYVSNGKGGPDLPLLLDAAGNAVALNTPANDGFLTGAFVSPRPWVSWQNAARNYGVGLAMDQGITNWDGWRGDGNNAPYFHNVRARITFGLRKQGLVRGLSYLALGGFSTVAAELDAVLRKRPPFGTLDAPAWSATTQYTAGQPLALAGWVLDTTKNNRVFAAIDGTVVKELTVGAARPDVCAVYPAYAGCPSVGFSGSISTANLGSCPRLLTVTARDVDGNETVIGERRLVAR
ncbi:MAG: hypothetical protein KC503_24120 [Myxococcales bacterium]|nr:hypothetical protein [Myxococcales bacterium]